MEVTLNHQNKTVTIKGNTYGLFDIPDEIWAELRIWHEDMANIMFMQLDFILEEERLEAERIAAIRRQEWLVRFAGMMAGKLKKQKEEEAGKGMGKAGPSGV